jgi:hypothetical protein
MMAWDGLGSPAWWVGLKKKARLHAYNFCQIESLRLAA